MNAEITGSNPPIAIDKITPRPQGNMRTLQQREGQRDLQQEAPLQYFDLCKLSWFIQIKNPLISAK